MGIDQSVDNFKSAGHSTVTTIALGQLWKTFNKMPIELLNGNERFVVFNISKIMPGGKHTRARARSLTNTNMANVSVGQSNALQYYYLCEFLPMFRLTTYRDIITIHAATCAMHLCECVQNICNFVKLLGVKPHIRTYMQRDGKITLKTPKFKEFRSLESKMRIDELLVFHIPLNMYVCWFSHLPLEVQLTLVLLLFWSWRQCCYRFCCFWVYFH